MAIRAKLAHPIPSLMQRRMDVWMLRTVDRMIMFNMMTTQGQHRVYHAQIILSLMKLVSTVLKFLNVLHLEFLISLVNADVVCQVPLLTNKQESASNLIAVNMSMVLMMADVNSVNKKTFNSLTFNNENVKRFRTVQNT